MLIETEVQNTRLKEHEPTPQAAHLQIVLPVYDEPVAKHVPHDNEIGVLALHADAVHPEELREQCAAMTLHYVLQTSRKNHRTVSCNKLELHSKQTHIT